jgi:hypothetical protein
MRRIHLLVTLALLAAAAQGCRCGALKEDAGHGLDRSHVWTVQETTKDGVDLLVRGARVDEVKGDLKRLVAELNRVTMLEWGRGATVGDGVGPPVLVLREVHAGVAHVEVADAEFLTQRMGTTGAHYYLTAATFTLTESPDVRTVDFMFEEGDHAAPGVYTRESFKDVRVVAPP